MVLSVRIRLADNAAKLLVRSSGLPALHDNLSELCRVQDTLPCTNDVYLADLCMQSQTRQAASRAGALQGCMTAGVIFKALTLIALLQI